MCYDPILRATVPDPVAGSEKLLHCAPGKDQGVGEPWSAEGRVCYPLLDKYTVSVTETATRKIYGKRYTQTLRVC